MNLFATIEHMTTFGRPLWQLYSDRSYRDLNEFALLKLRGGLPKFNIESSDHIFAALASRISLDPCLTNAEGVRLARNALNLHLRFVTALGTSGWIETSTPSEPVIADAVAGLLMRDASWESPAEHTIWTKSIGVL